MSWRIARCPVTNNRGVVEYLEIRIVLYYGNVFFSAAKAGVSLEPGA